MEGSITEGLACICRKAARVLSLSLAYMLVKNYQVGHRGIIEKESPQGVSGLLLKFMSSGRGVGNLEDGEGKKRTKSGRQRKGDAENALSLSEGKIRSGGKILAKPLLLVKGKGQSLP